MNPKVFLVFCILISTMALAWQKQKHGRNLTHVKYILPRDFGVLGIESIVENILKETLPYGLTIWQDRLVDFARTVGEFLLQEFSKRVPTINGDSHCASNVIQFASSSLNLVIIGSKKTKI